MHTATKTLAKSDSGLLTLAFVAFLGAAVVFVTGFAHSATLHDAAHDTRHGTGFACH